MDIEIEMADIPCEDAELLDAIHHPHDHFFKAMMNDPRVAREFIETYVNRDLVRQMDLTTLQVCKGSFVDERLKETETDILLRVMLEGTWAYFYVLVELQRKIDADMPYRVLKYKMDILDQHRRTHRGKVLPVVHAIVLYNGDRRYTGSCDFFDLFGDMKSLARQTFFAPFQLIDLTIEEDEILRERKWAGTLGFMLKHARSQDFLALLERHLLPTLHWIDAEGDDSIRRALIYYGLSQVDDQLAFINFMNKNILTRWEELGMSGLQKLYSQWVAEGVSQGLSQGISEGFEQGQTETIRAVAVRLLQKGMDALLVSDVTGLSPAELRALVAS
ncbi:MAG: hypothetical protein A3J38_03460 [Gammaproteobacteria bacterium RIFCSPHIGHO2_12_FULL_45_9]|nr:MAG: hypothetical protein A3J38_03460 [Gammaproteobacteria bacterium RIFCSPHIGHO2_12_FULL_45_9]